ncbi:MAG: cytochrome c3 family protein [Planctomycetota bacterium]
MRISPTFSLPGLLAMVACATAPARAQDNAIEENMCVMCHGEADVWEDDTQHLFVTVDDLAQDIHWRKGIRCQDCHGGNSETLDLREAHALEDGFRKIESPSDMPGFCGYCHSDEERMRQVDPEARLDITDVFWESVHGKHLNAAPDDPKATTCISCHPKHNMRATADPESAVHAEQLSSTCSECHQQQYEDVLASAHWETEGGNQQREETAVSCSQCHGDEMHDLGPVNELGSPVFASRQVESCGQCHEENRDEYLDSVHGHGLVQSGLLTTAVCANCHGAHGILPASDEKSTLHVSNVADTCAQCHRFIEETLQQSVHGQGAGTSNDAPPPDGDVKRKASCTDCHQGHDLADPETARFRNTQPRRCGNCHARLTHQYGQSMHGELTDLGYTAAAKCADCHGFHDIRPVADSASKVSSANRVATCAKCHPNANVSFASFAPHADHRDPERFPLLYWTHRSLLALLACIFGFFGIHSLAWLVRGSMDAAKHGRPRSLEPGEPAYIRFVSFHRVTHAILGVSFLGLALTGLPLKYSDYHWARDLAYYLGGFESTGLWHRLFAITTFACFLAYPVVLVKRYRAARKAGGSRLGVIFGPDSPLPRRRDLKDFIGMLRWFVGLGPKPAFERWAYWEKFDFWGANSDVILIGTTGLILWFPNLFCSFLPGEAINVAKMIHSTLALLATGFVFAMHFYNTHFRPDKFPMDMSVLTGLVSEDELRHDRPEYFERLRQQGELQRLRREGPSGRTLWLIRVFGFIALGIGLALLAGILYALFAEFGA